MTRLFLTDGKNKLKSGAGKINVIIIKTIWQAPVNASFQ